MTRSDPTGAPLPAPTAPRRLGDADGALLGAGVRGGGAHGGLYADLAADYELLGELGRGGSAVVYRARDRRLGREVALKVVRVAPALAGTEAEAEAGAPAPSGPGGPRRSEAVARLAREARTIAALEHPHIVRVHAVRELPDGLALEMPRIQGRTLKQLLAEQGPLAPERAARLLGDVARALAFAHARGVVHRDVKPENVFVEDATGHALLADFGVARSAEADAPEARLTQTGVTLGTPAYMSPEQIEGRAVDGRSDVYSLGLLGWELLTGQRPWAGAGLFAVLQRQQQDALPPIEAVRPAGLAPVPLALQYVLERMMQKAPGARWATADAVAAQLARPMPPADDFGRWRRHHARRLREARRSPRPPLTKLPAALVRATVDTLRLARSDAGSATDRMAVRTGSAAPRASETEPEWAATSAGITSRPRTAVVGALLALLIAGLGTGLAVRGGSAAPAGARAATRAGGAPSGRGSAAAGEPTGGRRIASISRGDVARGIAGATPPSAPRATVRGGLALRLPAAAMLAPSRAAPAIAPARAAPRRGAVPSVGPAPGRSTAPLAARAVSAPAAPAPGRLAPAVAPSSVPGRSAAAPGALARLVARVRGVLPFGAVAAGPQATALPAPEPKHPPHPPALLGAWAHGDTRSRYGDSLLLELRADGSARRTERRYALGTGSGWRVVHAEHAGTWEMRYGAFGGSRLCVTWRGTDDTSCESAIVARSPTGPVMTYGGRHWRPSGTAARTASPRRVRRTGAGEPAGRTRGPR